MVSILHPISKYQLETQNNPWILNKIPQTFVLRVMDHEKVIFIGKVKALQSVNKYGSFSILAGHTNFISIIYKKLFYYPVVGSMEEIPIDTGMIRYLNNAADIYLGIEATDQLDELELKVVQEPKSLLQQRTELEQSLGQASGQKSG